MNIISVFLLTIGLSCIAVLMAVNYNCANNGFIKWNNQINLICEKTHEELPSSGIKR